MFDYLCQSKITKRSTVYANFITLKLSHYYYKSHNTYADRLFMLMIYNERSTICVN